MNRELFINSKGQYDNEIKKVFTNKKMKRRIKSTIFKLKEIGCGSSCHQKSNFKYVKNSDRAIIHNLMLKLSEKRVGNKSNNNSNINEKEEEENNSISNAERFYPVESTKIKKLIDFLFNW